MPKNRLDGETLNGLSFGTALIIDHRGSKRVGVLAIVGNPYCYVRIWRPELGSNGWDPNPVPICGAVRLATQADRRHHDVPLTCPISGAESSRLPIRFAPDPVS